MPPADCDSGLPLTPNLPISLLSDRTAVAPRPSDANPREELPAKTGDSKREPC